MAELPRVMRDIVKTMVLYDQQTPWLANKYLRRGRLVEAAATNIALGKGIEDGWWKRGSGNPDDPDDYMPHEECRPAVEGAVRFLGEMGASVFRHGLEVINPIERYQGHLDWIVRFKGKDDLWIIDLKHGQPPPERIKDRPNPLYTAYRRQTALYKLALAAQHNIIAKRAGLHLFDGTYKFIPHEDPRDFTASQLMVRSYHDRRSFAREG